MSGCGAASLVIRVIDNRLGLVAAMEAVCTECDTVLNSTLVSDRIDGSSSRNVPFVAVRQAVVASVYMGVGHAGLVKLCRFLDMKPLIHLVYETHKRHLWSEQGCCYAYARWCCHRCRLDRQLRRVMDESCSQVAVWDWLCRWGDHWPCDRPPGDVLVLPAVCLC